MFTTTAIMAGSLTASKIGSGVLVTTISKTASSLYKLIKFIMNTSNPGLKSIQDTLELLDLEYYIKVINKLLNEYGSASDLMGSVKESLFGVEKILQKIHDELIIIKEAYDKHKNKYFYKWRTFQCKYNIETIKKHKLVLNSRFDMLVKLLIIYKENCK
uniref:Uncharacterized protein n=1 Tax=Mimivirus LCMiAC02 TaxID=2506609 RepID=A0A4D5XFC3_9VIRU|nr:MAG: uncharacterized protein LCMiAC02_03270 [Mimivirus LCMiAC02]